MGSYWSVPYLTKKSVVIEPAVKHETTEEKKTSAAQLHDIVANDMLNREPFVELEEKRALSPIIEEKTHSIETQTDVVEPTVVEPVEANAEAETKTETKTDNEIVETKAEPTVTSEVEVKVEIKAQPVVEAQPAVNPTVESLPDLSSVITPPSNQFNSVSHAVKKSNKKNRKH